MGRAVSAVLVAAALATTLVGIELAVLSVQTTPGPPTSTRGSAKAPLPAAAAGTQIRAASWNICGEAGGAFGSPAYCPYREQPDRKVDALKALIDAYQLNVVMLQESCAGPGVENQRQGDVSMLNRLQARLGPEWSTAWSETQRPGGRSDCRSGLSGTRGVALAVHGTILQTTRRPLPVPHGPRLTDKYSQPTVLCVRVATPSTVDGTVVNQPWRTEVCTTHLVNDDLTDSQYAAELGALTDFIGDRPSDLPHVVIGGDFNTRRWATRLKTMHDRYDECDEKAYSSGDAVREPTIGPATGDGKIDYLFASAGFTACDVVVGGYQDTSTTAVPNGASDHAPIVGYTAPLS